MRPWRRLSQGASSVASRPRIASSPWACNKKRQTPPKGPDELARAQREERRPEKADRAEGMFGDLPTDGGRDDEPELSSDPRLIQQLVARAERRPGRQ